MRSASCARTISCITRRSTGPCARGRYALAYAAGSIVYHKEGGTIGSPEISARAECLALRNRLLFTRKRVPVAFLTVWLGFLVVILNRLRRGQFDRIGKILRIMSGRWELDFAWSLGPMTCRGRWRHLPRICLALVPSSHVCFPLRSSARGGLRGLCQADRRGHREGLSSGDRARRVWVAPPGSGAIEALYVDRLIAIRQ